MSCQRLFTVLIIAALAAFIFSCGGGNSPLLRAASINPFNKAKPNVLTREGELAKLEALQQPANLSTEQWGELKAAMAAVIPAKTVCTPPRADEGVTDFAFSRDTEGVGSLSWSCWLRNDYNRDGIVDAADVTEIAAHFGEAVADSPANWIVDTSGDGFIGVSDVTGIALRYGLSLFNFSLRNYTSETEFTEIALIPRADAAYDDTGVMHFTYLYDSIDWVDLALVPQDLAEEPGFQSNMILFHPVRIQSVTVPSGKVGDAGTFSVEVQGAEPITYDWVLTNACNPKRSTEATVDVTLVNQGLFSGKIIVSNPFGREERQFQVIVGIPPTIESVSPSVATTSERTPFSAVVIGSGQFSYLWTFGGGFPATSTVESPSIEFDSDGIHNCSLVVTNIYGSVTFPFAVTTGSKPEVVKVTPLQGALNQQVQLTAEVLGTEPIAYAWDFAFMSDPATSNETHPSILLTQAGTYQCRLTLNNEYGTTEYWFSFVIGIAPTINEVFWTTTVGSNICWFFADVDGTFPMTWQWTMDMWAPSPPLVFEGIPKGILLPGYLGVFDCQLEATNAFGSDIYDFQFEIDELPPPPV
jgi:PKD repeat protein